MTSVSLRVLLEARGRRVSGLADVWELAPSAAEEAAVLDAIRALGPSAFVVIHERPEDWELKGFEPAGPHTWRVPASISAEALLGGMLHAGAWRVYASSTPLAPSRLSTLYPPGEGVPPVPMIDAWHDNTEWRVYVPEPAAAEESGLDGQQSGR